MSVSVATSPEADRPKTRRLMRTIGGDIQGYGGLSGGNSSGISRVSFVPRPIVVEV